MYKIIFIISLSLFIQKTQAQLSLIKGDSTSTINLYGDERLKVIEKKYHSKHTTTTKKIKVAPTKGFRIQIYNGADRTLANNIKKTFVQSFPGYRSYLLFAHPNYRIRVGDFKDRNDANSLLQTLKSLYPNSMIVNDVINAK